MSTCSSLAAAVQGYVTGAFDVDELEARVERALLDGVEWRDPGLTVWC